MHPVISPMTLGDIFERTVSTIGRVFTRSITLCLVFLTVPAIFATIGIHYFYSAMAMLSAEKVQSVPTDTEAIVKALSGMVVLACAGFVCLVGYAGASLSVITVSSGEMCGQHLSVQEVLRRVWSARLVRAIGQVLLIALIVLALFIGAIMIAGILSLLSKGLTIVLGFFGILFGMGLIIYVAYKWTFSFCAIAWDDESVLGSLGRSSNLVGGNWWRVFGILLLLDLISRFAVSMVTMPVFLFTSWGGYAEYFKYLGELKQSSPDPAMANKFLASISTGLGIYISCQVLFLMLVEPVYKSVLYFDLRARNGEFNEPEPVLPEPPISPPRPAEDDYTRFMPGDNP
jgi:hypothetical protein